jgi:aminopeptidase N
VRFPVSGRASAAFALFFAISAALQGIERQQLPTNVRPLRYELELTPDPEALTFSGHVTIAITVNTASNEIVLNEKDLTLDKAMLDGRKQASVVLDVKLERAALRFDETVATGEHRLVIDYHGKIGNTSLGFFAMDYEGPFGKRRTLATNFEPAHERRFMPSWDEPGCKAVFRLSVAIPEDQTATSNMPVERTERLPKNRKLVRFAPSPKMSTYLFFWPLEISSASRPSQRVRMSALW